MKQQSTETDNVEFSECTRICGFCVAMISEECDLDGHEVYVDTEACDYFTCLFDNEEYRKPNL